MNNKMKINYGLVKQYISTIAATTLKKPVPPLRFPFVDPGSVYDGNLWDWDSFWAVFGLKNMDKSILPENWGDYARGNVLNFLDHQLEDGYIPMLIETHKEETVPWLNRQHLEGRIMNMHKPFLCQQALLVANIGKDDSWLIPCLEKLEKYFTCYDNHYYHKHTGLYIWADDIMIGMDNDPASFGRPPWSTANIYLNSFMVKELQAFAEISHRCGNPDIAIKYSEKADLLIEAIHRECWDPRDGFFYSVDIDVRTRPYEWIHQGLGVFWKSLPIRIQVWSGFLPMWANLASEEQAQRMVEHYRNSKSFNAPGGIRTLSREEKMYNLEATNNPSNWLGPVWIVASYCVFKALLNYGYLNDAEELAEKTLELLAEDIRKTGTLHEYYNPESCEPVMNSGFVNWNILALNMFDELEDKTVDKVAY